MSKKSRPTFRYACSLFGNQHSFHSFVLFVSKQQHARMHSLHPAKICALCRHGFKTLKRVTHLEQSQPYRSSDFYKNYYSHQFDDVATSLMEKEGNRFFKTKLSRLSNQRRNGRQNWAGLEMAKLGFTNLYVYRFYLHLPSSDSVLLLSSMCLAPVPRIQGSLPQLTSVVGLLV
jgi:hypothetical protein